MNQIQKEPKNNTNILLKVFKKSCKENKQLKQNKTNLSFDFQQ